MNELNIRDNIRTLVIKAVTKCKTLGEAAYKLGKSEKWVWKKTKEYGLKKDFAGWYDANKVNQYD